MINFDEELRKFPRSMEVDQIEEAVNGHDMTDITDVLLQMLDQNKAMQNQVMNQPVIMQPINMPTGQ